MFLTNKVCCFLLIEGDCAHNEWGRENIIFKYNFFIIIKKMTYYKQILTNI